MTPDRAASYRIPLWAPASRAGIEPNLAFDQLEHELEGSGAVRTSYAYDALGRPLRTESSVDGVVTYEWDTSSVGRLARSTRVTDQVSHAYEYDGFGRPSAETTELDGESYRLDWGYDIRGRVDAVTYPMVGGTRRRLDYVHDELGFTLAVEEGGVPIWTADAYDAHGRVTEESFANGVTTAYTFEEETSFLSRVQTTLASGRTAMDVNYGYDAEGNVTRRFDPTLTVGSSETYQYDGLDRLTRRFVDSRPPEQYAYDDRGNLVNNAGATQTYSATQPHRLERAVGRIAHHDARGRIDRGPDWLASFTDFDLPRTLTIPAGVNATFRYDAGGERVEKREGANRTTYIHGLYERRRARNAEQHVWNVEVAGRVVAQIEARGATGTGEHTTYVHADRLGSPTFITGEGGGFVERYRYTPFGARTRVTRNGTPIGASPPVERAGFTGHESEEELGLVNAGGRMFDPTIGRFLTPDPIVRSATARQAWNPYSYVENNPETASDPSGFGQCDGDWSECAHDSGSGGVSIDIPGFLEWGSPGWAGGNDPGSGTSDSDPNGVSQGHPLTGTEEHPPSSITIDAAITQSLTAQSDWSPAQEQFFRARIPAEGDGLSSGLHPSWWEHADTGSQWTLDLGNGIDESGVDDFATGFGDSASFQLTRLARDGTGNDQSLDYDSDAYFAGEATELGLEGAATLGGAALRHAAARVTQDQSRRQAARFITAFRAGRVGGQVHHINVLAGHPGPRLLSALPLRGLPAWLHSGRWNLVLLDVASHQAAHRQARVSEAIFSLIYHPFAALSRVTLDVGVDAWSDE